MDEKTILRLKVIGPIIVGISYFLPWASIVSPFGMVELKGLYVDYAWIIPLLALSHLSLQFAVANPSTIGLTDSSSRYADAAVRIIPLIFVAFFAWYGASFEFSANGASAGTNANLFGLSVSSIVRAGLDYGYWIGAFGAVLAATSVGISVQGAKVFIAAEVLVILVCVSLAFALYGDGRTRQASSGATSPTDTQNGATSPPSTTEDSIEATFDATPYVTVVSISASQYQKNLEAERFHDSIVISPIFRNVGNKTVVGIQGRLSVKDGFGNEVYGFNFRDDDKILPGRTSGSGGYSFDGNQFEDDDPYHKMLPLVSAGTAKYVAQIKRIAFADGTVLPNK